MLSTTDKLNLPNLVGVELFMCRRALIREAHRLHPHNPDYTGVHHYMGWQRHRDAGATHPGHTKFVADALRDEAAIAKETRKARQERQLTRSKGPPAGKQPKGGAKAGSDG